MVARHLRAAENAVALVRLLRNVGRLAAGALARAAAGADAVFAALDADAVAVNALARRARERAANGVVGGVGERRAFVAGVVGAAGRDGATDAGVAAAGRLEGGSGRAGLGLAAGLVGVDVLERRAEFAARKGTARRELARAARLAALAVAADALASRAGDRDAVAVFSVGLVAGLAGQAAAMAAFRKLIGAGAGLAGRAGADAGGRLSGQAGDGDGHVRSQEGGGGREDDRNAHFGGRWRW
jgi:hypothetical protein